METEIIEYQLPEEGNDGKVFEGGLCPSVHRSSYTSIITKHIKFTHYLLIVQTHPNNLLEPT
jgi:hypothetical protein